MQAEGRTALSVSNVYRTKQAFRNHIQAEHQQQQEVGRSPRRCDHCPRQYRYPGLHYLKFHSRFVHCCRECGQRYTTRRAVLAHAEQEHALPVQSTFLETESSFSNRLQLFSYSFAPMSVLSIEQAFDSCRQELTDLLLHQLAIKQMVRFSVVVFVQYRREDALGDVEERTILPVRSSFKHLYLADTEDSVRRYLRNVELKILSVHDRITTQGSDWRMDHVAAFNVEVGRLSLRGGCGKSTKQIMRAVPKRLRKYVCNVPNWVRQKMTVSDRKSVV